MMKRTARKPGMTRRVSMMGSSSKKPTNPIKMDETTMWIGIGLLVLIVFLGGCYCYRDPSNSDGFIGDIKNGFTNLVGKVGSVGGGGSAGLKELDVIYFMSPGCPWCQKMNKVLTDSSAMGLLTVVDVTKPEGAEMAKGMGAAEKGIPAFISKKNKTGTVGFKANVGELVKELSKQRPKVPQDPGPEQGGGQPTSPKMDPNQAISAVQDLQLLLFTSPTCGYCNKLKTDLSEAGVLEMIEIVDMSTDGGQAMAKELLKEVRGVPVTMSRKTGKSSVGYRPLGDIINELS